MNLLLPIASRLISMSTECLRVRFLWETRKKPTLEHQRSCFLNFDEEPWIRRVIGSIRAQSWVTDRISPNLPLNSLRFHFLNHNLSQFQFQFCFFAILFFKNFSPIHSMVSLRILIQIQWFLILWIYLRVLFPKISNCLISINISLSNWIKFENIPQNYLNSLWIQPLFTTIPLNSWLFLKIGEFGIYFDSWPCVFNDLVVSIRHLSFLHIMNTFHSIF